jgi:hypothetical protein
MHKDSSTSPELNIYLSENKAGTKQQKIDNIINNILKD